MLKAPKYVKIDKSEWSKIINDYARLINKLRAEIPTTLLLCELMDRKDIAFKIQCRFPYGEKREYSNLSAEELERFNKLYKERKILPKECERRIKAYVKRAKKEGKKV